MSDTIIAILKQTDAFQSLADDQIKQIAGFAATIEIEKGQRLFREGLSASHLYVIADGKIDLRFEMPARQATEAHTISTLSQNGIIGWSSLIPPYKYKLSAYCVSDTSRLIQINGGELVEHLKNHPKLGYQVLSAMIRVVGNRFDRLQEKVEAAPMAEA